MMYIFTNRLVDKLISGEQITMSAKYLNIYITHIILQLLLLYKKYNVYALLYIT